MSILKQDRLSTSASICNKITYGSGGRQHKGVGAVYLRSRVSHRKLVQHLVIDLVDDAVVAGAHSPLTVPSDKLLGTSRAGFLGKQLNDSLNSALGAAIQLAHLRS